MSDYQILVGDVRDHGAVVAALYVDPMGIYSHIAGVECWGLPDRDAREYAGPHPVVCHPPCARWGRYWFGGPSARVRRVLGDDDGCFEAALTSVRRWGGVIEHPEGSHAWKRFHLPSPPRCGGWTGDLSGGWTCCVEQGWYGHRARKATWLYAVGVALPELRWGRAPGDFVRLEDGCNSAVERRRAVKTGSCQRLSHRERAATPEQFAVMLVVMARSARRGCSNHKPVEVLDGELLVRM